MAPNLLHGFTSDDADVVVIAQDPMEGRARDRPARSSGGSAGAKTRLLKDLGERGERMVSRGKEIERQLDQRSSLRIDCDAGHLPVAHRLADVQVTEPGWSVTAP